MFALSDTIVRIQSKDRDSGTSSDFRVTTSSNLKGVWQVMSCILPDTLHTIRAGINDSVTLSVGSIPSETVTLAAGYYTGANLATEAASKINAGSFSGISAAFSSLTNKISLTHSSSLITVTSAPGLGWDTATATPATTVTADNVIVTRQTDCYNIMIDECEGQNVCATRRSAFFIEQEHVGREYSLSVRGDTYLSFADMPNLSGQHVYFRRDIPTMHVYIHDDQGRAVNLHGAEWSFVLRRATPSRGDRIVNAVPQTKLPWQLKK